MDVPLTEKCTYTDYIIREDLFFSLIGFQAFCRFISYVCELALPLSSRDRKRPAGQVCVGEAFSKLAKYERDSGKWKMQTKNVATYAKIPIPQRARADEELTRPLAWWRNSEPCLNWTPRRNWTLQVESVYRTFERCQHVINRTRQFIVGGLSCHVAPHPV